MVDQLNRFAGEVTRVAREVGTEGRLGGQANVPGVAGTWKDLTDSVNSMAGNLTAQVRNIAEVTTAVARGDLSRKITVDVKGEILELKNTINTMVDQLNAFRRRSDACSARSGHRRKTRRTGGGARSRRNMEGSHRLRELHGRQPDSAGEKHRRGGNGYRQRRLEPQNYRRRPRRNSTAERNAEHDGRAASLLRGRSHARRPRSGIGRTPRRSGQRARCGRHMEGPYRLGQLDGRQPDSAGEKHRRSDDCRGPRRFVAARSRST